jgi:hypothetical protein
MSKRASYLSSKASVFSAALVSIQRFFLASLHAPLNASWPVDLKP